MAWRGDSSVRACTESGPVIGAGRYAEPLARSAGRLRGVRVGCARLSRPHGRAHTGVSPKPARGAGAFFRDRRAYLVPRPGRRGHPDRRAELDDPAAVFGRTQVREALVSASIFLVLLRGAALLGASGLPRLVRPLADRFRSLAGGRAPHGVARAVCPAGAERFHANGLPELLLLPGDSSRHPVRPGESARVLGGDDLIGGGLHDRLSHFDLFPRGEPAPLVGCPAARRADRRLLHVADRPHRALRTRPRRRVSLGARFRVACGAAGGVEVSALAVLDLPSVFPVHARGDGVRALSLHRRCSRGACRGGGWLRPGPLADAVEGSSAGKQSATRLRKLIRDMGWKPKYNLETALRDLYVYWKEKLLADRR